MEKPSLVTLLAGAFMLLFAIYAYYLLNYQYPVVLIVVGVIVLIYLQNSGRFK